jgi:hypothetical protein
MANTLALVTTGLICAGECNGTPARLVKPLDITSGASRHLAAFLV